MLLEPSTGGSTQLRFLPKVTDEIREGLAVTEAAEMGRSRSGFSAVRQRMASGEAILVSERLLRSTTGLRVPRNDSVVSLNRHG